MSDSPASEPLSFVPKVSAEEIRDTAFDILQQMLRMLHFQTEIETEITGPNLRFRIKCEDAGRLIGRGGSNLSSLQFLLNRLIFRKVAGAPRVYLDVEGFKEEVDDGVIQRAEAAAEQVRRWGESLELAPMNSYERRVVHQHFANHPEVVVESVQDPRNQSLKRMILKLKNN
jgi:spoIIIJ-associated protein